MRTVIKITLFVALTEAGYVLLTKLISKFRNTVRRNTLTNILTESINSGNSTASEFHTVLFFPDQGITCPKMQADRKCRDPNCKAVHSGTSMGILVKVMNAARKSIDVCIYLFTSSLLADALVEAHNRGVIVRLIIDDRNSGERADVPSSQIGKLREAGISVHCYNGAFWMHHKFMVVDNEIITTGSFNWTNQAAMGNLENLIITSQPQLVKPFIKEFQNLYEKLQLEITQEDVVHKS